MTDKTLFGEEWAIWIAICIAVTLRILAQPPEGESAKHRISSLIFSVVAGFASAYYFYHPVVDLRGLDHEVWDVPVAILLALTGQNLVRFFVNVVGDFEKMKEVISVWRGKGGSK